MDTSIVRKGDFFVKRFVSTRIAGGFLLRNGSLALQANHAQQAKAKSFKKSCRNTAAAFSFSVASTPPELAFVFTQSFFNQNGLLLRQICLSLLRLHILSFPKSQPSLYPREPSYFLCAILRYSDGNSPVLVLKFAANLPPLEYPTAEATCSIARSVETRSISA